MTKAQKLGKGLSALLNTQIHHNIESDLKYIDLGLIYPNPEQPRKEFNLEKLNELSDSIRQHGVIEPIVIFKNSDQRYMIISGERRWRAAKLANLIEIPAILKKVSSVVALEMSLVENIQRQDLTLIEEAEGYAKLIEEYKYTQEDVSKIAGKSRSHVANIVRLTSLSESIKTKLSTGIISMGHAKVLIGLDNSEEIAEIIVNKSLNVRQTENLVSKIKRQNFIENSCSKEVNEENSLMLKEIQNIKELLEKTFQIEVKVESKNDKGKIILHFNDMSELDNILTKLT